MGDRCYLEITYRKEDEPHFVEQFGKGWYEMVMEEGDTWQTVTVSEANYGFYRERHILTEKGVCFLGWHGPGGDYGEAVFAAFKGKSADVPGHERQPYVPLNPDGSFDKKLLKEAKLYHNLVKKVRKFLGMKDS